MNPPEAMAPARRDCRGNFAAFFRAVPPAAQIAHRFLEQIISILTGT